MQWEGSCHRFLSLPGGTTLKSPRGHTHPLKSPLGHSMSPNVLGGSPPHPIMQQMGPNPTPSRILPAAGVSPCCHRSLGGWRGSLCHKPFFFLKKNIFLIIFPHFCRFLHGQSPAAAMGQSESEPQEEAEVGNVTVPGHVGGVTVTSCGCPHPGGGLSCPFVPAGCVPDVCAAQALRRGAAPHRRGEHPQGTQTCPRVPTGWCPGPQCC